MNLFSDWIPIFTKNAREIKLRVFCIPSLRGVNVCTSDVKGFI